MSEKLPDIQAQPDYRNIPLDRVGIKDLLLPITVLDRKNGKQTTVAKVDMFVNLPHNFRGTHMSRFVEVLTQNLQSEWIDKTGDILKKIRKVLSADDAHIEIEFPYFIEKFAPVTRQPGLMSYNCRFSASYNHGEDTVMSVSVPVMTLCPCSKEISEYGAHNQRCIATASVRYKEFVWIEEIVEIIESSASGEMFAALKRPDEKYVTEHAYENPMFVEDIVREIAVKLDAMERVTWYLAEAESQESIHNHNAYARVEKNKA